MQHLVGQDYSWASSAFYYGYLVATPIASVGLVKFPLGKFLTGSMLIWGIVATCHGAVNSMASLTALRVLLGVFESSITPGLTLLTGIWYKRSEHAMRHGIWFAGNSLTGIFGGVMCYGIGHIKSSLAAWRVRHTYPPFSLSSANRLRSGSSSSSASSPPPGPS